MCLSFQILWLDGDPKVRHQEGPGAPRVQLRSVSCCTKFPRERSWSARTWQLFDEPREPTQGVLGRTSSPRQTDAACLETAWLFEDRRLVFSHRANRAEKTGPPSFWDYFSTILPTKSFPMLGNRTVFSFVLTAGLIMASRVFEVPRPNNVWWGVWPVPGPEA